MAAEWAQRLDGLAARHRAGDPVDEELYEQGRRMVRRMIRRRGWYLAGAAEDDLVQEGMIGFWGAVRHWRPDGGMAFAAFAEMCVTRAMITAQTKANRLKHQVLSRAISLDTPLAGARDESRPLVLRDIVGDPDSDPAERVIEAEDRLENAWIVAGALQGLSNLEREAVLRITRGQSYAEAAWALGTTPKAIDNALQRARRKLLRRREALSA